MSGMECSDYGTAEESAFVSGLASTLDGVETDHIGDTECDDVSRRRTQAAGDEGGEYAGVSSYAPTRIRSCSCCTAVESTCKYFAMERSRDKLGGEPGGE